MDMNRNIICIIIGILILYLIYKVYFIPDIDIIENISTTNYADQPYLFKESEIAWEAAHKAMRKGIAKNPYISFDMKYKANPKDTFIPGKLDKSFKCKNIHKHKDELDKIKDNNIKELQKIVKDNQGRKIRASGGHHTFNKIGITDDIIVKMYNLKNVLNVDKKKKQVTVESGILLQDLNLCLERNGLALHVLPAIPYQSLGGCLSTSTHGSRPDKGSMSSVIVDITMVLADGSIKTFNESDEEFKALCTGLGCLGIIYSVTLQCEDLYAVEHKRMKMPWEQVKQRLDTLRDEYLFFQAYIKPLKKDLSTTVYLRRKMDINKVSKKELLKDRHSSIKKVDHKIDYGHRVLTKNLEASFYTEKEIAVPFESFENALNDVIELIKEHKKRYGYDTRYSFLCRFTGEDKNSLLSMVADRPLSVFINTFVEIGKVNDPKKIRFFKEFEDLLVNKYNGRPHYGKQHSMNLKKMKKVYGKNIDEFNRIRNKLDPNRMFSNDYINKILGE
jgi:L-gulonolactone oxidase